MHRLLKQSLLVLALSALALLVPKNDATASARRELCGSFCVYGGVCDVQHIQQYCTSLGCGSSGACGDNGQCPGGFRLICLKPNDQ